MDLHTVTTLVRPTRAEEIPAAAEGDAPLAGGTWLFSEPQRHLRRLVDLGLLGWDEMDAGPDGLRVGAACTLTRLSAFEASKWPAAAALFGPCCRALVASFKVLSVATVGGNLCLALPAGSVAALATALGGTCLLRAADGTGRAVPAGAFVTGERRTVLRPGELLRAIHLPAAALAGRAAIRRIALSPQGRTGSLVIGTEGVFGVRVTVAGAVTRPVALDFPALPDPGALAAAVNRIDCWHDDVHGAPDWRRHVSLRLAEEVRTELAVPCG